MAGQGTFSFMGGWSIFPDQGIFSTGVRALQNLDDSSMLAMGNSTDLRSGIEGDPEPVDYSDDDGVIEIGNGIRIRIHSPADQDGYSRTQREPNTQTSTDGGGDDDVFVAGSGSENAISTSNGGRLTQAEEENYRREMKVQVDGQWFDIPFDSYGTNRNMFNPDGTLNEFGESRVEMDREAYANQVAAERINSVAAATPQSGTQGSQMIPYSSGLYRSPGVPNANQPMNLQAGVPFKDQFRGTPEPAADMVQRYFQMSNDDRGLLQQYLVDAGYINEIPDNGFGAPESIHDDRYISAFATAIGHAQMVGKPVVDYLRELGVAVNGLDKALGEGSGGNGRLRPTVQLTSELQIRQALNEQAKQTIGRELTKEEKAVMAKMVTNVRSTERRQQNTFNNAYVSATEESGGEVNNPDSVSTLAEEEIEQNFEQEKNQYSVMQNFNSIMQMARRPGGM